VISDHFDDQAWSPFFKQNGDYVRASKWEMDRRVADPSGGCDDEH
jgi:hypothetical protein